MAAEPAPGLQPCLAAAADWSPVYPTSTFSSTMREITCTFKLADDEAFEKLTSTWIAVDVGDVAPPNYEIARADLALNGMKEGRLSYSQDNPLPVGTYKLAVLADGKPWGSADFKVVSAEAPQADSGAIDFFPLELGRAWSYWFEQTAGALATIDSDQATSDGKLARALVTMTVAGEDDAGVNVELRRNGKLITEEWWSATDRGLVATARRVEGQLITLNPPQVLVSAPPEMGKQWKYAAADGSFSQTYTMWGPLAVPTEAGPRPGYVVLTEQSLPLEKFTVERHFVPGHGMTREIIIHAGNGKLISRQELTLTAQPNGSAAPAPPTE